jgi:hypothetical protein
MRPVFSCAFNTKECWTIHDGMKHVLGKVDNVSTGTHYCICRFASLMTRVRGTVLQNVIQSELSTQ